MTKPGGRGGGSGELNYVGGGGSRGLRVEMRYRGGAVGLVELGEMGRRRKGREWGCQRVLGSGAGGEWDGQSKDWSEARGGDGVGARRRVRKRTGPGSVKRRQ